MKGALDVHRELLARDVPHEIVRLPRIVLTADELPEVLGLPAARCWCVRLYVADVGLVGALVPAGTLPSPAALLAATGSRAIRLATPDEINRATDFAAGLVAPLPLSLSVPLLAGARAAPETVVYTPTGDAGCVLGIRAGDLLAVTRAQVLDLLAAEALVPAASELLLPERPPR